MLHAARGDLWRLWATARSLRDPQYGLTAVLDDAPVVLPSGIEATLAPLERRAIAFAALACADLLVSTWPGAIAAAGAASTAAPALAQHVRDGGFDTLFGGARGRRARPRMRRWAGRATSMSMERSTSTSPSTISASGSRQTARTWSAATSASRRARAWAA